MDWNFSENKAFENAIAELGHDCPNLVQQIALRLSGKSFEQIQAHYDALFRDVEMIESGHFDEALDVVYGGRSSSSSSQFHIVSHDKPPLSSKPSRVPPSRVPRRKPTPWTEEEHEAFVIGLEKYGKGDWKSISRFSVQTKSPTQVASHAQKYFLKLQRYDNKQEPEVDILTCNN